jgi:hypothetical protein
VAHDLLLLEGDGAARGVARMSHDILWWAGVILSFVVLAAVAWIFSD